MLEFAKQVFEHEIPDEPGQPSQGAQLRQVQRTMGELPQFVAPVFVPPAELAYLYELFWDLSHTRTHGLGLHPIQYAEILSWSQLHLVRLDPWEVQTIRKLDNLYLSVIADKYKTADKRKKGKPNA